MFSNHNYNPLPWRPYSQPTDEMQASMRKVTRRMFSPWATARTPHISAHVAAFMGMRLVRFTKQCYLITDDTQVQSTFVPRGLHDILVAYIALPPEAV